MALPPPMVFKASLAAAILGFSLVAGIRARLADWTRGDWVLWLCRPLVAFLALGAAAAAATFATTHSGPDSIAQRLVPLTCWVLAGIYSVGQLVEFATEPLASVSPDKRASPLAVSPLIVLFLGWAVITLGVLALGKLLPWLPAQQTLVVLLGLLAVGLSVSPPRWLRDWAEAAPGPFGPMGGRVATALLGVILIVAGLMGLPLIGR